jgi:hypothetical protein
MAEVARLLRFGAVCALAVVLTVSTTAAQDSYARTRQGGLPPAGFGTLGQDDIGIRLHTPDFVISVIPLHEGVIRLLAPDTYRSMSRLLESKADDLTEAARRNGISTPTVFLVSFFGTRTRTRFDAEALTITGQSRLFRPRAFLPMSPSFGDRQVAQRETATAIYIYEDGLRLFDPFTIGYDGVSTDAWARILRTLERESAAVAVRAAAARRDTTATRGAASQNHEVSPSP